MGVKTNTRERVRREELSLVKHDKLFTDWKVLVGSKDWENHKAGREGAVRYHVHNLPQDYFGPGVYELGLIPPPAASSRRISREDVVVVYVGQADHIRQRLQSHGQGGSHLGPRPNRGQRSEQQRLVYDFGWPGKEDRAAQGPYLNPKLNGRQGSPHKQRRGVGSPSGIRGLPMVKEWEAEKKGRGGRMGSPSLMEEAFREGYTLVFRYAKASTRSSAKAGEAQLLSFFDYAWNLHGNGDRRPQDVLVRTPKKSEPPFGSCFCFKPSVSGVVLDLKNEKAEPEISPPSPRIHWRPSDSANRRRSAPHTAIGPPRGFASVRESSPLGASPGQFQTIRSMIGVVGREGVLDYNVERRLSQSGSFLEGVVLEDMPNLLPGRIASQGVCGARMDGGETCGAPPVSRRKRCADHKGERAPSQVCA